MEANRYFLSELAANPLWLEGAQPFFQTLAGRYRLVLVTNGDADTQRMRIQRAGLAEHCEGLVISDEVGFAKPHPKIFEHALRVAGVEDKSSVLMIGDNAHADISGALSFGIDACWYNPQKFPWQHSVVPTFEARDHSEIYTWLRGS